MNNPDLVYSVGECPVCPGFGQVLVLMRIDAAVAVFYCPACGTAWSSPPGAEVNDVKGLDALAPAGAVPASEKNVDELGVSSLVQDEVPYADWKSDLDAILTHR